MRKSECGKKKVGGWNWEGGMQKSECGLRPLRAVGSIYEPEAVGAIGAYAPEGRWNAEFNSLCFPSSVLRPLFSVICLLSSVHCHLSSDQGRGIK